MLLVLLLLLVLGLLASRPHDGQHSAIGRSSRWRLSGETGGGAHLTLVLLCLFLRSTAERRLLLLRFRRGLVGCLEAAVGLDAAVALGAAVGLGTAVGLDAAVGFAATLVTLGADAFGAADVASARMSSAQRMSSER